MASQKTVQDFYVGEEISQYFTVEERENLRKEVVMSINHELIHPEDLEVVVPKLLRASQTEARELRRSMNAITSLQMVEGQRALDLIQSSSERISGLRQHFLRQAELVDGIQEDTITTQHLRQLHILRRNVGAVVAWSRALKEVRYENLFTLIPKREFVVLYNKVKQLQNIRHTVVSKAGTRYLAFQVVFDPYFSKLEMVSGALVSEIYALLEEESANIAIQKALEESDTVDPPAYAQLRECCSVLNQELDQPVLFDTLQDQEEPKPAITTEKLTASVSKNITTLWHHQVLLNCEDPVNHPSDYFYVLKKVEPLIEALQLALVPLSTAKFFFFDVVLGALHDQVIHSMDVFVDQRTELDANVLLDASQYMQWYRGMLVSCHYAESLDLRAVDELSAVFMTTAVTGLSDHLSRLCRACGKQVLTQTPTISKSHSLPTTCGPVDLFAIIQQTLGGLSTLINVSVMIDIGNACVDAILTYLFTCRDGLYYEDWEDAAADTEDWQQRRMLLLYAMLNDCSTVETNLDSVELKFSMCWDTSSIGRNNDSPFVKVQDALAELQLFYLDAINDQVNRVVAEQWTLAFRDGPWYDEDKNPVQLILVTQADYIEEEFVRALSEPRVRKLSTQMLGSYVVNFLSVLLEFLADCIRNSKKYRVPDWGAFVNLLVRDIDLSVSTWRRLTNEVQADTFSTATDALNTMKELLCVKKPVDMEYVIRDRLMEKFGDCPTFVLQYALEARPTEVSSETKERMLRFWADTIRSQHRNESDVPTMGWGRFPSVFGQVDKAIGQFYKAGGFFSKSGKKKVLAERQIQAADAKNRRRNEAH